MQSGAIKRKARAAQEPRGTRRALVSTPGEMQKGEGEGEDPPLRLIFLVINTRHSVMKVLLIGLGGTAPKSRPKQLQEGVRGGSKAKMGKAR